MATGYLGAWTSTHAAHGHVAARDSRGSAGDGTHCRVGCCADSSTGCSASDRAVDRQLATPGVWGGATQCGGSATEPYGHAVYSADDLAGDKHLAKTSIWGGAA